ncbi:hypothetical protein [Streptomyces sp. NPDC052496]|uniref:hypothetical protein n=1 Tax=Streptomyces sp. NPDC052496 TaxID=3154951 RepID=UPI00342925C9
MPPSRLSSGHLRASWPALLAAVAVAALLSGCTPTGEPRSTGRTQAASAPTRLWQEPAQPPASSPEDVASEPTPLEGVPKVPSGDIREAPWIKIVKAQSAVSVAMGGTLPFDENTTRRINRCTGDQRHDRQCPVRPPRYQDLSGDGKPELIVGITSGRDLAVWVYQVRHGQVVRIMDTSVRPVSVEVTGGNLIVRERDGLADYERRTVYSWDERNRTMQLRIWAYDPIGRGASPSASGSP